MPYPDLSSGQLPAYPANLLGRQAGGTMPLPVMVAPPKRIVANGQALPNYESNRYSVVARKLQNVGITAVKYWFQETAPDYTSESHGILGAASSLNAGDGGQLDCSQFATAVWVGTTAGGAIDVLVTNVVLDGTNDLSV